MSLDSPSIELAVSEFVALINQTMEYAYQGVVIHGELANLRVSKNRWVYFDLKDEFSTVKFFGNVYQLPGPLEDGMLLKVRGTPKLHNLYGFSVNVANIQLSGEGTIKKAAELLKIKLEAEGLFDPARKRQIPYPPKNIGLITSKQSAAYADFVKILNARWQGINIELIDVQVQGEASPAQISGALEQINSESITPDVIVIIRGGGSPEDLAAFSSEQVTRTVAASRVPTLVAIGHEIDLSLAELAADLRASTPSNAAELLVPDRSQTLLELNNVLLQLEQLTERQIQTSRNQLGQMLGQLDDMTEGHIIGLSNVIKSRRELLDVLNPEAILRRGYAVVRKQGKAIRQAGEIKSSDIVDIQLAAGSFTAEVQAIKEKASAKKAS